MKIRPDKIVALLIRLFGVWGGTIGVIKVERDGSGGFTRGTKPVEPYNTIYIPGGNTIPGITMSHDGRYLYVTCEGSHSGINPDTGNLYRDPTNVRWTRNAVVLCPGCRHEVWVAVRGRNTQLPLPLHPDARGSQVLGFNRSALGSGSPNNAFVGYGDTHGTAPVGLALFNNDTMLAVANSNRFHAMGKECTDPTPPPGVPPCTANVAIMDVKQPRAADGNTNCSRVFK